MLNSPTGGGLIFANILQLSLGVLYNSRMVMCY